MIKKVSLFLTIILFFEILLFIYHNSSVYFLKKNLKNLEIEIFEISEEIKILESEYLSLQNLENLEKEMLNDGYERVKKENIFNIEEI